MASARARGVASMTPVSRTPLDISRDGVVYHDFGFGHCERRGTTQAIVASHEHAPGGPAGGLAAGVAAPGERLAESAWRNMESSPCEPVDDPA